MIRNLIGVVCLACLLGTGCHRQAAQVSPLPPPAPPQVYADAAREMAIPLAAGHISPEIDTGKIQGDIENVSYAGDTTVLIEAGQLYLYDLSAGRVLSQAAKEPLQQPRYQPCGKGYAAIGNLRGSMDGKIIFYDGALKKQSELSFSQLIGPGDILLSDCVAVSPAGDTVAYWDQNGITVYSLAAKTKTLILNLRYDVPAPERAGILHISQLLYARDGRSLFFLSGVESHGGQSIPAWGKINTDGTGLVNQTGSGFTPYEIAGSYDGFALFGESEWHRSGRVLALDAATGSPRFLPLATMEERAVFGSDSGKYYATDALSQTDCTVRIYETATGQKVFERSIPHGGNPLYVARNPVVRILDQTRTCIVLMGNRQDGLETKVACFPF